MYAKITTILIKILELITGEVFQRFTNSQLFILFAYIVLFILLIKYYSKKRVRSTIIAFLLLTTIFAVFVVTHHTKCDILILGLPGDEEAKFQRHLISTLNESLFDDSIYVIGISKQIDESTEANPHELARKYGAKHHASLVLWGSLYSDSDALHYRITLIPNEIECMISREYTYEVCFVGEYQLPAEIIEQTTELQHVVKGIKLYRDEDYYQAISELNLVSPDFILTTSGLQFTIGSCYLGLAASGINSEENYHNAINTFTHIIDHAEYSIYSSVYINRGVAYIGTGDSLSAFDDYNNAIAINPHDAKAITNRGSIYLGLGKYEEAMNDYDLLPENWTVC